jgi:hypothetical protein
MILANVTILAMCWGVQVASNIIMTMMENEVGFLLCCTGGIWNLLDGASANPRINMSISK